MNKIKVILGVIAVLALIVVGANYALGKHDSITTANKDKYASAYESHSIKEPFNLLSKQFQNGRWLYVYVTTVPVETAVAQLKSQITGGGYQVIASHPDTKTILYRDLITGDVSVKAEVSKTATGQTAVYLSVSGIGKE